MTSRLPAGWFRCSLEFTCRWFGERLAVWDNDPLRSIEVMVLMHGGGAECVTVCTPECALDLLNDRQPNRALLQIPWHPTEIPHG